MSAVVLVVALLTGSGLPPAEEPSTALSAIPVIGGLATWFDVGPGKYGAAGPVLRDALGGDPAFRGQHVTVCHAGRCTTIVLSDWCACGPRHGKPTLVDLSADAFRDLAPLGTGVIDVTIELGSRPKTTPPATDMAPLVPVWWERL